MSVSQQYGKGRGIIWLDAVGCFGREEHIDDCTHRALGDVRRCNHYEDVGVNCGPVRTESKYLFS